MGGWHILISIVVAVSAALVFLKLVSNEVAIKAEDLRLFELRASQRKRRRKESANPDEEAGDRAA